jgi:hypothetical protein
MAVPNSLQAFKTPYLSSSASHSRAKGEYSSWTASMWTILEARRRVRADASERPMYLIFPCLLVVVEEGVGQTMVDNRDIGYE